MAKLTVLNFDKTTAGEVEFNDQVMETPYHPHLIQEAVVHYLTGKRQGTHATKTRSEVSGSTRKPWKQKGTGRARAGSTKSPIWKQGGIVFGPHPRSHSKSINKKVRKKALQSALAEKFRNDQVLVLDHMSLETHKTKAFYTILSELKCLHVLIVVDEASDNLERAARNIPKVEVVNYRALNVYRLLQYEKVIFVKDALTAIEQRLLS
ncbi:MAG: 50S ribosomal protein L4 [SAR324 cluster bacterium]|nr:50S ribosomal protein L4 [SAR324 cluster bacterium]